MADKVGDKPTGLELLRKPFPPNQISKLPKPTKKQSESDKSTWANCRECGGWHHPQVIHLDYVGHAALTDRLLDADPSWTWKPFAVTDQGLPAFDASGGLWIKLTVCGQTRIGYGHAASSTYKEIGSREKEVIGDALRNAAMRFGAALDLWHKGDLHADDADTDPRFVSEAEEKELTDLIKSYGANGTTLCETYGVTAISEMTPAMAQDATAKLHRKYAPKEAAE